MKYSKLLLLTSVACMGLSAMASNASAETITTTTKTVIQQKEIEGKTKINFMEFDRNGDNVLSTEEVGEKLFYLFDVDGNEVIDNIEFDNRQILTIVPMEKQTFTYVDVGSDGDAEQVTYTHETFFDQTDLSRFDKNMDGFDPAPKSRSIL